MDELELLMELINGLKTDVVNSLQANVRNATGDTIKALETAENGNQAQLLAPGYIDILETGRGPTSPNAPAGDPTLFERIKVWCDAKGVDEKLAYAITQKIHKSGYVGKPGVLSEPLSEENISRHANEIAGKLSLLIITDTLKIPNTINIKI